MKTTSILDIFNDYQGRRWSHNVAFIVIMGVCVFLVLTGGLTMEVMSLLGKSGVTELGAGITTLITPLAGIAAYSKKKAVDQIFGKEEQENVQSSNA